MTTSPLCSVNMIGMKIRSW